MKTEEIALKFPVLGFTADLDIWGFQDLDRLTRCGPRTLKEDMQSGMELIDAGGRRWRVVSIRRTGRAGSVLSLIPGFGPPQSRIEHELEALEPVSIEEVRRRARVALEAHSAEDYYGDDGQADFRKLLASVARAKGIARIYDLIQPDTFEPY